MNKNITDLFKNFIYNMRMKAARYDQTTADVFRPAPVKGLASNSGWFANHAPIEDESWRNGISPKSKK
jgi:hypothetical protein